MRDTVSGSDDSSVPAKQLLRGWAVTMLLVVAGAYLLGGAGTFGTVVDILVPTTVLISLGVLAWQYEVEK